MGRDWSSHRPVPEIPKSWADRSINRYVCMNTAMGAVLETRSSGEDLLIYALKLKSGNNDNKATSILLVRRLEV